MQHNILIFHPHSIWNTVDIILIPPILIPPFFIHFGSRVKTDFKGKYQISRYHTNSYLFYQENAAGGDGGISLTSTVHKLLVKLKIIWFATTMDFRCIDYCLIIIQHYCVLPLCFINFKFIFLIAAL